jgi:hypothetical protein
MGSMADVLQINKVNIYGCQTVSFNLLTTTIFFKNLNDSGIFGNDTPCCLGGYYNKVLQCFI